MRAPTGRTLSALHFAVYLPSSGVASSCRIAPEEFSNATWGMSDDPAARPRVGRCLAATFHPPIYATMLCSQESEPPVDDGRAPEAESPGPDDTSNTAASQEGITPEQLAKVIRRLETGFYDRAEVRDQIARRLLDELDR